MNFDIKASNIILSIFQMKIIFPQNVFFNPIMLIWMKTCPNIFCEIRWNFAIVIEMV